MICYLYDYDIKEGFFFLRWLLIGKGQGKFFWCLEEYRASITWLRGSENFHKRNGDRNVFHIFKSNFSIEYFNDDRFITKLSLTNFVE